MKGKEIKDGKTVPQSFLKTRIIEAMPRM